MGRDLDNAVKSQILNVCRQVAAPHNVIAVAVSDPHVWGYADEKSDIGVVLIAGSPRLMLRHQLKPLKDGTVSLLAVDQKTFERDVERDWLGGLLVENMLTPYEPLVGSAFLWEREVKAKKRIVTEILTNLVLEYPYMSSELLIKPEYFMFEAMARKAALYPPVAYRFQNLLNSGLREKNRESIMKGFRAALESVALEGLVSFSDEYIRIEEKYVTSTRRRKLRVVSLLKVVRSSVLRYSLEAFPKMMRSLMEDYRLYAKNFPDVGSSWDTLVPQLEDPKKHMFIPTPLGLVSLSDEMTIQDFVRRTVPDSQELKMDIRKLGGVLNAVYALRLHRDNEEERYIVKVFRNWLGWKWFPLALWALGTRGFAVLGKSRMEREYALNKCLSSRGVNVPRIIYMSPKERLIFQEYVEGENLARITEETRSSKRDVTELAATFRQVGRAVAEVHKLDVALGDCKPENIIVKPNGTICFVDLEQAERGGDQPWDIAELLFYSGLHASLLSTDSVRMMAGEFIEGYMEASGRVENMKKAVTLKYVKVFFFTPPHVLSAIFNTFRERLKGEKTED